MILGLIITVVIYYGSLLVFRRWPKTILNPVLISTVAIIGVLLLTGKSYTDYFAGARYYSDFLGPIVVMLAIPLYKNQKQFSANFKIIISGILAGMAMSFVSIFAFTKLLRMEQVLFVSLLPKSITTPLAVEVSGMVGGNTSLAIAFVIFTGLTGNALAPLVMKLAHIESDVAKGIGIGTSSHGLGTAKAVELSAIAGAMSGVAMGITGLLTVLVTGLAALLL